MLVEVLVWFMFVFAHHLCIELICSIRVWSCCWCTENLKIIASCKQCGKRVCKTGYDKDDLEALQIKSIPQAVLISFVTTIGRVEHLTTTLQQIGATSSSTIGARANSMENEMIWITSYILDYLNKKSRLLLYVRMKLESSVLVSVSYDFVLYLLLFL